MFAFSLKFARKSVPVKTKSLNRELFQLINVQSARTVHKPSALTATDQWPCR